MTDQTNPLASLLRNKSLLEGIKNAGKSDTFSQALDHANEQLRRIPEKDRGGASPQSVEDVLHLLDEIADGVQEFKELIREDSLAVQTVGPSSQIMHANRKLQGMMVIISVTQTAKLTEEMFKSLAI